MSHRELVADLIEALSNAGSVDHLDAYGGALFALDLDEALEVLAGKGWEFKKTED